MPRQRGRDLRVEHGRRDLAAQVEDDLQILSRGMQDLGLGQRECREQIAKIVELERVQTGEKLGRRDLDQAQLGEIGTLSFKLGIQRYPCARTQIGAQFSQILRTANEPNIGIGGHSLKSIVSRKTALRKALARRFALRHQTLR